MALVCPVCGLPEELCVCGTISAEQQAIKVRLELRRYRKKSTIIEGIDPKSHNLSTIAKRLKAWCACGGSAKNGQIILQGDHRERMPSFLERLGFPKQNIEIL
ncbi:MAG: stress response translation initiation inhibitor YciH [Nitrososphaeria archaeon]|nr:stress response translation initiation inhibitor YciH [Nitrososphaeria archaeon]NIN52420.1 stress response translation initiation inhibitor YciH [Nitrososphaeria archaeon]NIQ34263.1 stress response translation initiation inhibitor YciH [Nitrososphaeria archaeon]